MTQYKKYLLFFLFSVACLVQFVTSFNGITEYPDVINKKICIAQNINCDKQNFEDVPIKPILTKQAELPPGKPMQRVSNNLRNVLSNENELCDMLVGVSKEYICRNRKPSNSSLPKNCKEIQESGQNASGIYEIFPVHSKKSVHVLCDMDTNGGGWTYIQRRFDGSEDFFREWRDYKFGFGTLDGEFWIGLESIYHLTGFETNELLVELTNKDQVKAYAQYNTFTIGSEVEGYVLSALKGFSGDAGDSLTAHRGQNFSTKDFKQDSHPTANCAEFYLGAWWYKNCYESNLNGKFRNVRTPSSDYKNKGMKWFSFSNDDYFLSESRMLVRPNF